VSVNEGDRVRVGTAIGTVIWAAWHFALIDFGNDGVYVNHCSHIELVEVES
jgi:hypothetical protein